MQVVLYPVNVGGQPRDEFGIVIAVDVCCAWHGSSTGRFKDEVETKKGVHTCKVEK